MKLRGYLAGAAFLALTAYTATASADAANPYAAQCSACHQMTAPAATDIDSRMNRAAPPLYYAGNKFNESWLLKWLQNPTPVRAAGDYAPRHVRAGDENDEINSETLSVHPALDEAAAADVSKWLMTLTAHDDLIAKEEYTPGSVPERMGAMDFIKFKGCGACHEDKPGRGGLSGPELYTAWERLQPAFIVSYIRDPHVWEPRSMMPNQHLDKAPAEKLANYLKVLDAKREAAQ